MWVVIPAAGSALNWALYVNDPNPWSMFGGVFCGILAFAAAVTS